MAPNKKSKRKKLWWIFNQEEVVVGVGHAATKGGAFLSFEEQTGLDREGFRAAEMSFLEGCALPQ